MQSSQQLRFAGDFSLNRVQIVTQKGFYQDITNQVISIQFFEDVFSPFITGKIVVKESLDLINLFPFVGEEYLELDVNTPTYGDKAAIKGKYYIHKLTDRELLGDRAVAYQLHFISVEAIVDKNKKISRTFGDKVSALVKQFCIDDTFGMQTKKNVYVEETINKMKYTSNYWSPIGNINHLVDNAVNMNKTPNYVFFENRDGFYFISLESLYDNKHIAQDFVYDKYMRDKVPNASDMRNVQEDYKRILEISIPVGFDYLDRLSSGMLGSRQITYDATTKQYSTKVYNMFDRFKEQKHLNQNPINSDKAIFKANSRVIIYPKMYGTYQGFGDNTNARQYQERISTMKLAEANMLNVTVKGRCDYTVGQKVNVKLNRIEPLKKAESDIEDKIFSGKYLIGAVNHYFDREKHETHMQLIKESSVMNMNRDR